MILGSSVPFFESLYLFGLNSISGFPVRPISSDTLFAVLGMPGRIWALSSVHGDLERLVQLHDCLLERVQPGDRVVYLGNYTGYGLQSRECVDEILTFRRLVLSMPGMKADDLVYLRGRQEDLWARLLQLHFSKDPADHFLWMLGNGMGNTLESYGISSHDGIIAAQEGTMSLTRWTAHVRDILRACPGHDVFMTQYRRAAYTQVQDRCPVLFVNTGFDRAKPLEQQGDNLWWDGDHFDSITESYTPFEKIIRGFDPQHQGVQMNCVTASLDGGCGFGGSLVCAGMNAEGGIFELLEV